MSTIEKTTQKIRENQFVNKLISSWKEILFGAGLLFFGYKVLNTLESINNNVYEAGHKVYKLCVEQTHNPYGCM
ncbi:hypothetical protein [Legionella londiniensis]|uniref:Uncharacterized protein n=1 Tax=Legionella londiniensis TaxID=45068 RepID=A0A0W0VMM4_9GAMM|nr:hypothetical protein [Legionella londiniensis]KTD21283.1 hypothetical protein Llon_1381 [Legionella londiniensis]STX93309.1 Uncharacterised protein [Legionella londiniensis]